MPLRRPAPILFSACAATLVLAPCAAYREPPRQDRSVAVAPLIAERALPDIGGGETIREVHQDDPFSLVALTANDLTATAARFRARRSDGSWGPWFEAEASEAPSDLGDNASPAARVGTDPVFVGRTTDVQIAVRRPDHVPAAAPARSGAPGLGYRPASVERPLGPNFNAVLISPPEAPADVTIDPPEAVSAPGQPPVVISREQWGADEKMRCGTTRYDDGIRAAVVHHTAGSNEYAPQDSAGIVRSIYAYHTRTLGWCDIAYHALVDKYGQVFEGHFGGIDRPVEGSHTGGFNQYTWGVAMIGDFQAVPPTPIQLRTTGRLIGWRLGLDHLDPLGNVVLTSAGGSFTHFPRGATPTLPTIFAHRDVGNTACPGDAAYALMGLVRDTAAHFTTPFGPRSLADVLRGGAIFAKWTATGGETGPLGAPTSPEASGADQSRYATFTGGAVYWSPRSGAAPVTGAIYDAWGRLGFERGALGLPTSGEIQEPAWIVQNFQHGTLNLDRETGAVTRVIDGVALELPATGDAPVQLERIKPIRD